eukprot:sb/3465601/
MASVCETAGLVKLEENTDKEKELQSAASIECKVSDIQGKSIEIVECTKINELKIDENMIPEECKVSKTSDLDHSLPQANENTAKNKKKKKQKKRKGKAEENVPTSTENSVKEENSVEVASPKPTSDKPTSSDPPPPAEATKPASDKPTSSDSKEAPKPASDKPTFSDPPPKEAPKPARPDKLPDLPADLTPLFNRCTTMTARVLGLLKEKVTEDLQKNKELNNKERIRDLRSLLWKVCDCEKMGADKVKQLEGKSSYELQQMREQKKYGNRSKGKQNNKWKKKRGFDIRDARQFARGFVFGIIDKAVRQYLSEEEEKKARLEQVKGFVDDIITHSLSKLILERQHNLSSVEADLLLAMQEDEEEEDVVKTTFLNDSIKIEPRDN